MKNTLRAQAHEKRVAADKIAIECRSMVADAGASPSEAQIAAIEAKAAAAQELRDAAQELDTQAARLEKVQSTFSQLSDKSLDPHPASAGQEKSRDPYAFGALIRAVHPNATPEFRAAVSNFPVGTTGEDGGYLIPTDQRQEIHSNVLGPGTLLGKFSAMPTSSLRVTLPTDQDQLYTETNVAAAWTAQGATNNQGKITVFGEETIEIRDCKVMVAVPDELLSDAAALQAYVVRKLSAKLAAKLEATVMLAPQSGNHPYGLLSSASAIEVSTSTDADDVIAEADLMNMLKALNPSSMGRAFWLMNRLLPFDVSLLETTDGVRLFPDVLADKSLYGLPIVSSLYSPAVNQKGDCMLVDPDVYALFTRRGIEGAMSTEFAFDQFTTCFRASVRVGGKTIMSPIRLPDNTRVGQLAILATRS